MPLVDILTHRRPNKHIETWMPMEEVLKRVAARFPHAIIDRERGDRMVRDHGAHLAELSAHDVVLNDWRALEGRVAYVTIREDVTGPQFEFFLTDTPTTIDIDYEQPEDRDRCRPLLEALATALPEYDLVSIDPDEPPDLGSDDVPAALRDAISAMHVRWEEDIAIITAGTDERGEPFPQEKAASRHWCDGSSEVILDLTGFQPVPSQALIEWVQDVFQTVDSREKALRLVCPPGSVDERLTRYFQIIGLPMHATLAEALAACEASME